MTEHGANPQDQSPTMSAGDSAEVAFLDLANPEFSIRSEAVREARERNWYARTSYGLAILRYPEVGSLLRDARLRQGSYKWPAHNNATGLFADWWLQDAAQPRRCRPRPLAPARQPGLLPASRNAAPPALRGDCRRDHRRLRVARAVRVHVRVRRALLDARHLRAPAAPARALARARRHLGRHGAGARRHLRRQPGEDQRRHRAPVRLRAPAHR